LFKNLKRRISQSNAGVAILGLGYVGLPLALSFARAGFKTVGIDVSREKIRDLEKGISYIGDISHAELKAAVKKHKIQFSTQYAKIRNLDCVIICVPTPLGKTKEPDLSFVLSSARQAARHLKKGQLLVLESTTYPGTTRENIAPIIEEHSGLTVGRELALGFSPERVDPANKNFKITEIPKVVGGIDAVSTDLIEKLYARVFDRVVTVSSSESAEMVKLLENTFRSVNIALINEMAMICDTLGINVWEVIHAASTKPFGFMPFYPGPGIGGHCINIDSMYLAWKVRLHGYEPRLIELAQSINDHMPQVVVDRASRILNISRKSIKSSRMMILGMSYKKNVRDTRESPSLEVMRILEAGGAKVVYHDPWVPSVNTEGGVRKSLPLTEANLSKQDLVLILTDHSSVDYEHVARNSRRILDTRNVTGAFPKSDKIYRL
jgi:UDP-N-acetyl-D-glucosamine dehydrogenase